MRNHEFERLPRMRLQVIAQECELPGRQVVAAAVIEDCEMRLLVIEAVVQRMLRILFIRLGRGKRPYIVIAGREKDPVLAIWREHSQNLLPFAVYRFVVAALNRVTNGDYEIWMVRVSLPPHLFPDARNGLARAVSDNREAKLIGAAAKCGKHTGGENSCRSSNTENAKFESSHQIEAFSYNKAMPGLTWDHTEDIALSLYEAHPDVDPTHIRFTDLHKWVTQLPDFKDDPMASTEGKLEAIQMAWLEEYQDNQ